MSRRTGQRRDRCGRSGAERFIHTTWDVVLDVVAHTCESGGYCYVCEVQCAQDEGRRT